MIKLNRLRKIAMDLTKRMTQWKFVLGQNKIQYPFYSIVYQRVTNRKTTTTTKITATKNLKVHEWNQLMYYWWKIYELKPKSHLTKHTHAHNLVHLVLKLYTLDLFGNVINLLHLYANERGESLCVLGS